MWPSFSARRGAHNLPRHYIDSSRLRSGALSNHMPLHLVRCIQFTRAVSVFVITLHCILFWCIVVQLRRDQRQLSVLIPCSDIQHSIGHQETQSDYVRVVYYGSLAVQCNEQGEFRDDRKSTQRHRTRGGRYTEASWSNSTAMLVPLCCPQTSPRCR